MPRSLNDLIQQADAIAERLESDDSEPVETEPSELLAVHAAALRKAQAERDLAEAVRAARVKYPWWRIGANIGTSGEAARQRYGASSNTSGKSVKAGRSTLGRATAAKKKSGRGATQAHGRQSATKSPDVGPS